MSLHYRIRSSARAAPETHIDRPPAAGHCPLALVDSTHHHLIRLDRTHDYPVPAVNRARVPSLHSWCTPRVDLAEQGRPRSRGVKGVFDPPRGLPVTPLGRAWEPLTPLHWPRGLTPNPPANLADPVRSRLWPALLLSTPRCAGSEDVQLPTGSVHHDHDARTGGVRYEG